MRLLFIIWNYFRAVHKIDKTGEEGGGGRYFEGAMKFLQWGGEGVAFLALQNSSEFLFPVLIKSKWEIKIYYLKLFVLQIL